MLTNIILPSRNDGDCRSFREGDAASAWHVSNLNTNKTHTNYFQVTAQTNSKTTYEKTEGTVAFSASVLSFPDEISDGECRSFPAGYTATTLHISNLKTDKTANFLSSYCSNKKHDNLPKEIWSISVPTRVLSFPVKITP